MEFTVRFLKVLKCGLVTLVCLMMVCAIAGNTFVVAPTQATPAFPWEPLTLTATRTYEPPWVYYIPYGLWEVVGSNLSEIGITLDTSFNTDPYTWWSRVWGPGWNKPHANGGWDVTLLEWRLQPHALVPWLETLFTANLTPPEGGKNIFPWLDETADTLLRNGMHTLDATERKGDLWKWQEWFLHDPPAINVYNPRLFELMAAYVEGWNPIVRFHDISHLTINATTFNNTVTNVDRRAIGPNTTIYAVDDTVWALLPIYTDSCTEEILQTVQWNTLYRWGIKPEKWPLYLLGEIVDPMDWECVPDLALGDPTFMDGPNGPNTRARIVIRDNVKWSDNVTLTVNDVLFTFNTCTLNLDSGNTGYGDFANMIKNVTYYNETAVDFILYSPTPMNDLKSLLSNNWGGGAIMPFHKLGMYMSYPWQMYSSKYNTDFNNPENWIPVTGPFEMTEIVVDDHATFERNDNYFGYDLGWGPYNIDTLIFEWIDDAAARFLALKNNDIDFGEPPTAAVGEYHDLQNATNVRVLQYDSPASNLLSFNFNHPILSNRYVRQAIAHAIDYEHIFNYILPGLGIETAYRGLTPIVDAHYYTDENNVTVHLYNDYLQPYQTNITQAIKYMEMWWYAKNGTDYTKGPVGDADFSGKVGLNDFYRWIDWFGKTTGQISYQPGQDVDPDWDNNGLVEMLDFSKWPPRYGFYYPENSTTWQWSR